MKTHVYATLITPQIMTETVRFWCKSYFIPHGDSTDKMADCPNNFPGMHTHPIVGDVVTFEERTSDTNHERAIAILVKGTFAGWIRGSNLAVMHARLLSDLVLKGIVMYCKKCFWLEQG